MGVAHRARTTGAPAPRQVFCAAVRRGRPLQPAHARRRAAKFQEDHGLPPTGVVNQATWSLLLSKSRTPTAAELTNTDIGPWFTSPEQHGYLRELQHRLRLGVEHYEGP